MRRIQQLLFILSLLTRTSSGECIGAAHAFPYARDTTVRDSIFNVAGGSINIQQRFSAWDDALAKLTQASSPGALYDAIDRSDCLPGTRTSQLEKIMSWVQNGSSDIRPIIWLSGGVGAGKSTIAYTIAKKSNAMLGGLAGTFFFRKGYLEESSPKRVIPSLALQLAESDPNIKHLILESIKGRPRLLHYAAMKTQFRELIRRPIEEAGGRYFKQPSVVILDGLDECDDLLALKELLAAIAENVKAMPLLRFLITSRPVSPIDTFFPFIQHLHTKIDLGFSKEAESDIRHYLNNKFSDIRRMLSVIYPLPHDWPTIYDTEILVSKSGGHFIYASTVLNFIMEGNDSDHPKDSLDVILRSKHPRRGRQSAFADLDEIYLDILRKVANRDHLLRLLAVIHGAWKLNDCGIAAVLNIPLEDVQVMLRGLRPVVSKISRSEHSVELGFLHPALRDFLEDPSRSQEFCLRGDNYEIKWETSGYCKGNGQVLKSTVECDFLRMGSGGDSDSEKIPIGMTIALDPEVEWRFQRPTSDSELASHTPPWDTHICDAVCSDRLLLEDTVKFLLIPWQSPWPGWEILDNHHSFQGGYYTYARKTDCNRHLKIVRVSFRYGNPTICSR